MAMVGNKNGCGNKGKTYNTIDDDCIVDRDVERQFLRELENEGLLSGQTSRMDPVSLNVDIGQYNADVDPTDNPDDSWGEPIEDFDREPTMEELEAMAQEAEKYISG